MNYSSEQGRIALPDISCVMPLTKLKTNEFFCSRKKKVYMCRNELFGIQCAYRPGLFLDLHGMYPAKHVSCQAQCDHLAPYRIWTTPMSECLLEVGRIDDAIQELKPWEARERSVTIPYALGIQSYLLRS